MANHHEKPPQVGIHLHLPQKNGDEPYPPEHHDSTVGVGDHGADDVIEFENKCATQCSEGCLCKANFEEDELTPSQRNYLDLSNALARKVEFDNRIEHNNALLDDGPEFEDGPEFDGFEERSADRDTLLSQTTNPKDIVGAKKPDLSLVPPAAIIYMALAMEDGAIKYGPYNWRKNKVRARTYVAAMKRHIDAWLDGEECASDSGKPHLGHMMACGGILADAIETGNLVDDRPVPGSAARLIAKWTKS